MTEYEADGYPVVPHLGTEFMLWLWYRADTGGGRMQLIDEQVEDVELGEATGIDLWVDERIALRPVHESKVTAVFTGLNPSAEPEAKVAVATGKVVQELRMGLRTDDALEFSFTLKGPALELHGTKLPQVISEGFDGVILDRMSLLEQLDALIGRIYHIFATERVSDHWPQICTDIITWIEDHDDG